MSRIYKRKAIVKKGDKFGKLTAIKFNNCDKRDRQHWLFKCECGKEKIICASNVKSGNTKACGCIHRKGNNLKHGMIKTKIYKSWTQMKQRCLNKNYSGYKNYMGRGITICDEWLDFNVFYKDMGERPKNKSLDRINNNGNYCKENCRWATNIEQNNNRSFNRLITYLSKTQTVSEWSREFNIKYTTFLCRLNKGWSIEKIIN